MLKRLVILAALAGFTMSGGTAGAASSCKGLSSGKCDGATACYWVKGYKTKKGTNVSAHCRAKPNGGASAAKKKKSTAKKAAITSGSGSEKATSGKKKSSTKKKSTTSKKKASKKKPAKKKTDSKKKSPSS